MKTNKGNLAKLTGRLAYEAPRMSVQTVELEQGIAAGSVDPSARQQWETNETQSHEVSNDYWD